MAESFLDFLLENRKVKWLKGFENAVQRIGKVKNVSVAVALTSLIAAVLWLAPSGDGERVLVSGLVGLVIYLVINVLDGLARRGRSSEHGNKSTFKAGLIGFLYLELIDASFSLDGVVGAFAITKSVLLIGVGLGVGALFVRAMTVHMLRRGLLNKYKYLEHGAHYAIGILAFVMLLSIKLHVPEFVTGGTGILVIATALVQSHVEVKRHKA